MSEQFPTLDKLREMGFEFELTPGERHYPVKVLVVHSWEKNKQDADLMDYLSSGYFQNYAAIMLGVPWGEGPCHVVPHDVTFRKHRTPNTPMQTDLFQEALCSS